jgi:tocopherol cyclase
MQVSLNIRRRFKFSSLRCNRQNFLMRPISRYFKGSFFLFILLPVLLCSDLLAQSKKPNVMENGRSQGYRLKKTWKPAIFQGGNRKKAYYEGWYIKCVTADRKQSFALIPGIALGQDGEGAHAFIQYIDGQTAQTHWYEFPVNAFSYSQQKFEVMIGGNYFSDDSISVDVGEGKDRLQANLKLTGLHPWPVKAFSPGIMGWYRFVPGMETCHGLVSWHHQVEGMLLHDKKRIMLQDGHGYIEKDWGSSFPRSYVWMQTNSFQADSASFMCSIATIPYMGKHFRGFLGFFWVKGKLYRFATYTHAKLENVVIGDNQVSFRITERKFTLEARAERESSGELKAPQAGKMERRISESVNASISLRLLDQKGRLIFEGTGTAAGLEIVGDKNDLVEQP